MRNKFIEIVIQENSELDELDNMVISDEAKVIKLEMLEYKYRYELYLSLNGNVKRGARYG